MLAVEMVADLIPPVHTSDTVQKVMDRMLEFRVRHLPIVNEDQFLGLLSDDDLIEQDYQANVGSLALSLVNPYVLEDQHIYDVIRLFHDRELTVVPVLTAGKNYTGLITINAMNGYFAQLTAVSEPGAIIILEISNRNNSLAHMAQIVESDNAQILSSYMRSFPDSTKVEITLKVNKQDISSITATFLRYDYDIKAVFSQNDRHDDTMDRYDSLMNYLNL